MMKFRKLAVVLCCALAVSIFFTGCRKPTPNTESDLEIQFLTAGVGEHFLDELIEAFEAKHEDIHVYPKPTAGFGDFASTITAGAQANSIDLYFMQDSTLFKYVDMEENYIEPLDEVLNDGEPGKTVGDRLNSDYKNNYTRDGHIYSLPWQPFAHGIVYNHQKLVTELGLSVPRTTNELVTLCETLVGLGETPFIYNSAGYFSYATNGWWAQYEGIDSYFDFYNATDYDGTYPSKNVFAQQGRYEALAVLEQLVGYDDEGKQKYVYPGSNSEMHTVAQSKFLQGVAVMTPNAGWLETEMRSEFKPGMDFRFMRLPIISSIVELLSFKDDEPAAAEEKLRALVDYVDGGMTGTLPAGTTDADAQRIAEARRITVGEAAFVSHAVVPSYANAKDAAKEFLKFMYSDEGLAILTEQFTAMPLVDFADPNNIPDKSGWSTLAQSHDMLKTNARYAYDPNTCPIFYNNAVKPFRVSPEFTLGASNPDDRMDAWTLFLDEVGYVDTKWDDWTRGIV